MDLTSEYFQSTDLTIYQPKKGHRYGVESFALADFCRIEEEDSVVEFCSGVAVISLVVAAKFKPKRVVAIEIQSELYEISLKNVLENSMSKTVEVVCDDYRKYAASNVKSYDCLVVNPPFYAVGSGRMSADPQRAKARHELNGDLEDLLISSGAVLREGGRLNIVFPKNRRDELFGLSFKYSFQINRENNDNDDIVLAEFELK
ncbi:MAG: methyltransferase [Deltaproteobacteria bacterium]|jgi:tRNA1Val (adenine37-N6)-methyltransferase|nr:methyltransferase [Deltaproteobacteria bacterium]